MNTLSSADLREMLKLQDSMNRVINPAWLTARYPYLRAVIVEVAEALDHYGWKWWKKQDPDISQVRVELIDILHFMLSDVLVRCDGSIEGGASLIEKELKDRLPIVFDTRVVELAKIDLRELLELLAGLAVSRRCSFVVLQECLQRCDLNWSVVFQQYLSKNVLNIFRQRNGYKDGTYMKMWNGQEDNVHLVEISQELLAQGQLSAELLYATLERRYRDLSA